MIDNVTNHVGQALGKTPLPHPDSASMRPASGSDATIQVEFADILNRAKQTEQADGNAVQAARALLLSGLLTSPDNVRAAAQSILNTGI